MSASGVGTRRPDIVEVDDGEFDYKETVLVETSQKDFRDFWIRPIGGVVNQSGPFTFIIEPLVDSYLQLNRAGLEVKCHLVRPNGERLTSWYDIAAPVNLLGAVMWESVEVLLNGKPMSGASSMNSGYKAFIETMLSYDKDAGDSHLHSQFFHLDTPGQYHNMLITESTMKHAFVRSILTGNTARPHFPPDARCTDYDKEDYDWKEDIRSIQWEAKHDHYHRPANKGGGLVGMKNKQGEIVGSDEEKEALEDAIARFKKRRAICRKYYDDKMSPFHHALVADEGAPVNWGFDRRFVIASGSASFDLFSPITHDFFKLNNHVGPGNKIELKLTMHPHEFLINTMMAGDEYKLQIDDMKLHLHTIERKERIPYPMVEKYLMNETQMHKQLLAADIPGATFRIHSGGVMPKTIIVAMVTTSAADGYYRDNPFNFHHHYISSMALIKNGERYPTDGLQFDFEAENKLCSRAYRWMFENTGSFDGEKGNTVSWGAFASGSFIVPFDLTPDKCNGLHNHNAEYGYIDLDLRFSRPLRKPIYVLYEKVFNKVLINEKTRSDAIVLDIQGRQ